jgi:carboxypeptidase C (cathepsin A)
MLPYWTLQESNLIYVDQPTGTGFSYSSDSRDIRHNEASVSDDLYEFLQVIVAPSPRMHVKLFSLFDIWS